MTSKLAPGDRRQPGSPGGPPVSDSEVYRDGPQTRLTEIIKLVIAGDVRSQAVLATYLSKKVDWVAARFYEKYRMSPALAEEVSQTTVIAVWTAVTEGRFVPREGLVEGIVTRQFLAYFTLIFRSRLFDAFRSLKREDDRAAAAVASAGPGDPAGPGDDPVRTAELKDSAGGILRSMEQMAEPTRTVVFARLILELTFDEIGEMIGLTAVRAGQLYREGLDWLRERHA